MTDLKAKACAHSSRQSNKTLHTHTMVIYTAQNKPQNHSKVKQPPTTNPPIPNFVSNYESTHNALLPLRYTCVNFWIQNKHLVNVKPTKLLDYVKYWVRIT